VGRCRQGRGRGALKGSIGVSKGTKTLIELIDTEIAKLQLAKAALAKIDTPNKSQSPKTAAQAIGLPAKRVISSEASEKMAAGQKKRWAKAKRAAKRAAKKAASVPVAK
jgi:hypothetical protein